MQCQTRMYWIMIYIKSIIRKYLKGSIIILNCGAHYWDGIQWEIKLYLVDLYFCWTEKMEIRLNIMCSTNNRKKLKDDFFLNCWQWSGMVIWKKNSLCGYISRKLNIISDSTRNLIFKAKSFYFSITIFKTKKNVFIILYNWVTKMILILRMYENKNENLINKSHIT